MARATKGNLRGAFIVGNAYSIRFHLSNTQSLRKFQRSLKNSPLMNPSLPLKLIKSRKLFLPLVILSTCLSRAEVLVEQDFSKDPGWQVIGMEGGDASSFGWNSELQAIAAPGSASEQGTFARRNGLDAYFAPLAKPLTDATGFILKGDILMTSNVPYARIYLGLFEKQATAIEDRNAIYLERSRNPAQHYIKLYAVDASGKEKIDSKFMGLGKVSTPSQLVEVQYAAATRTLSWSVGGQQVDSIVLPDSFHFSVDACGVTNSKWSSGATAYVATGVVDNVRLETVAD